FVADFFPDTFNRIINSLLSAASDNDRCSFPRQRTGNREPDSGGRSCDQDFLPLQFQIHSVVLFSIRFRLCRGTSSGPIGSSTTLYFGLVFVQRRFDGPFQCRSAKWLEHIPKAA